MLSHDGLIGYRRDSAGFVDIPALAGLFRPDPVDLRIGLVQVRRIASTNRGHQKGQAGTYHAQSSAAISARSAASGNSIGTNLDAG